MGRVEVSAGEKMKNAEVDLTAKTSSRSRSGLASVKLCGPSNLNMIIATQVGMGTSRRPIVHHISLKYKSLQLLFGMM